MDRTWSRFVARSASLPRQPCLQRVPGEGPAPDRLEFISSFSNAAGEITPAPFPGLDDFPPETRTTVTFVDHAGKGRGTLVTIEAWPFNGTKAQRDFFAAFHDSLRQGWTGTMQQLAGFLGA